MRESIFHGPTIWRHLLCGALPFVGAVVLFEKLIGEWSLGLLVVILAGILPFIAIGWLGYQHWRHLKTCPDRHPLTKNLPHG